MNSSEKEPTPQQKREWAQNLGSIRSDRKTAAAFRRYEQNPIPPGPGRTALPLDALECTCDSGGTPDKKGFTHKHFCPRGRAERRRAKNAAKTAQPLRV